MVWVMLPAEEFKGTARGLYNMKYKPFSLGKTESETFPGHRKQELLIVPT